MKEAKVTISQVLAWRPCDTYATDRVRSLFGRRKALSATQIVALDIPAEDRLWALLHEELVCASGLRLFSADCAERALLRERKGGCEPAPRSLAAIEIARRFAYGEATEGELHTAACAAAAAGDTAAAAAYATACAADAAYDAADAYAAAHAAHAASAAAWASARAAAWASARAAADAAADAAYATAAASARASAHVARSAENKWQLRRAVRYAAGGGK